MVPYVMGRGGVGREEPNKKIHTAVGSVVLNNSQRKLNQQENYSTFNTPNRVNSVNRGIVSQNRNELSWIRRKKTGHPENMRPVIHGLRDLEDRKKKTGHPEDMRPVIHRSRGPEDQRKKTDRLENMRPVIHGSRDPEDQRKKINCPDPWIKRSWRPNEED